MEKKIYEKFFFLLLSFLPVSIIVGSAISLINVLILNILFVIVLFTNKDFNFLKDYSVKLIIFLYFYLIFNLFVSIDYEIGLVRNVGFLRVLLLFLCINYYFYFYQNKKNFFKLWTIIFVIFVFDVFLERFFGSNLFGWGGSELNGSTQFHEERVVSFFKDEPIAGGFLLGFIFLIFGNLLINKNKKILPIIFLMISFSAILLTGERANTIKAFVGILVFFYFADFFNIKTKLTIFIIFTFVIFLTLSQSEYLERRYLGQLSSDNTEKISLIDKISNHIDKNLYFKLYGSGYEVFKNHKIFGVGNKNYRVETCANEEYIKNKSYLCSTHPHQIYFEFLSEHGILGTTVLLCIFFSILYRVAKEIIKTQNYLQLGAFTFVIINFIPLVPSGSFFSDFNLTIFWINFSIMIACNKNTNIFVLK